MRTYPANKYILGLIGLLFVSWQPVAAQQAAQQEEDDRMIEEVIVTARKVAESIQDAPITINALTDEQLRDAGVTQTADFIQMIPNVTLAESQTIGTSFLTVRGLSRVRNGELPVAVVVDDVLVVNARQFIGQVFDTRQIEVVKGPQGALYGRNASNGAIIITTNPPSDVPEGHVALSFGKAREVGLEGVWSGPLLSDKVAIRLSGRILERDGYFENVTLDKDVDPYQDRTLRGRLRWTASDTLAVDFKASVSKHEGKGIGFHWPGDGSIFGNQAVLDELGITKAQADKEGANLVGLPYVANNLDRGTRDAAGFSLKIDKSFGIVDVKSVTTYDELTTSSLADRAPYLSILDGTQHSYADIEGWSQEIRFSSNTEGRIRWQAGGYFLAWERLRSTVTGVDTGEGIEPVTDVPEFEDSTNPTDLEIGSFLSFTEDSQAWALFGSVDWDIMDRLTLSLAARYDSETREQTANPHNTAGRVYRTADANGVNQSVAHVFGAYKPCEAGEMENVNCGDYMTFMTLLEHTRLANEKSEKDFSKLQPKITLAYEVSEKLNLYGSWGIGYRAGQFNYPGIDAISTTAKAVIDQEENQTFELGMKLDLGNFRFNAAYFNSQVENTQYFPFNGVVFVQIFEDIDEASLQGVELEAFWRITANWDLYASYGLTQSEIDKYAEGEVADDPGTADEDESRTTVGNDLPYVPEHTFNAGARFEVPLFGDLSFFARVDYELRGEQFWTPQNTNPRDPLSLVNLRLGVQAENWTTSLYINNATDEEYNSELVSGLFLHPAPPRVWRVDFRYAF